MCIYNRRHSTSSHTQLLATVICCSLCFDISLNYESSFMYRYTPEIDRCGLASCQRASTHTQCSLVYMHLCVLLSSSTDGTAHPRNKQKKRTLNVTDSTTIGSFVVYACVRVCVFLLSFVVQCHSFDVYVFAAVLCGLLHIMFAW